MDAASWPLLDIKAVKSMEEVSSNACTRPVLERKARPQEQLNCPRCNSTNTKFCYYNNYSLTQPRYFCKTCRRYWTEGGSLRNVPVGGGSRKNKRPSSSSSSSSSITTKLPDLNPPNISQFSSQNPKIHSQDLNMAFPVTATQATPYFLQITRTEDINTQHYSSSSPSNTSALELLRTGIASRGLSSFVPTPISDSNALYSSGFQMQEFKPTLSFGVEEPSGVGSEYGVEENGGRILFPLGELKNLSSTNHNGSVDENKGTATTAPNGFWNGLIGGGGGSW